MKVLTPAKDCVVAETSPGVVAVANGMPCPTIRLVMVSAIPICLANVGGERVSTPGVASA